MFDNLDEQLTENDCDHDLKLSIKFLKSLNLGCIKEISEWLNENVGAGDCEGLANVEEMFDDNVIFKINWQC